MGGLGPTLHGPEADRIERKLNLNTNKLLCWTSLKNGADRLGMKRRIRYTLKMCGREGREVCGRKMWKGTRQRVIFTKEVARRSTSGGKDEEKSVTGGQRSFIVTICNTRWALASACWTFVYWKKGRWCRRKGSEYKTFYNLVMQRILSIAHFHTSKCSNHRCERVRMIASILLTGCPN